MSPKTKRAPASPPRAVDVQEVGASAQARFTAFTGSERRRQVPALVAPVMVASIAGRRRI